MLRILSLGAGVQSSTVLLMSCVGDLPKLDHAIFADTQWERRATYDHLEYLTDIATQHGIPIHRVSRGSVRDFALHPPVTRNGKFYDTLPYFTLNANGNSGMANRNCTMRFKIAPIQQRMRSLAGLAAGERCATVRVEQWIGISADEAHRMKPAPFPWVRNRYPLIEDVRMKRRDCLEWLDRHGFRRAPRSACIGCPFHNDLEWREIRDMRDEWADAVAFERDAQRQQPRVFLHPQRIPLDRVDLSTAEERGQGSLFGNECDGVCGV